MFHTTTDPQFNHYLKATQGGTVRLDLIKTPSDVAGLCTDGMSACIGIVIISEDKQKISLTHTDLVVSEDAVVQECLWAGQESSVIIVKGKLYSQPGFEKRSEFRTKSIPRILRALTKVGLELSLFDAEQFQTASGAVAIDRAGNIQILPPLRNVFFQRIGQVAPYIDLRHAVNMVRCYHLQAGMRYHPLDLQYDGLCWTECPGLDETLQTLVKQRAAGWKAMGFESLDEQIDNYLTNFKKLQGEVEQKHGQAIKHYRQKSFKDAIGLFKTALEISGVLRIESQSKIATISYNIGSCYKELGENQEAITYLQQTVDIRKELLGEDHEFTKKAADKLEGCRLTARSFTP
jgi:hypothetical protein